MVASYTALALFVIFSFSFGIDAKKPAGGLLSFSYQQNNLGSALISIYKP
jgi:hypothetical protein